MPQPAEALVWYPAAKPRLEWLAVLLEGMDTAALH